MIFKKREISVLLPTKEARRWRIPSNRRKGVFYEVLLGKDYRTGKDRFFCSCPALKECKHIAYVKYNYYEENNL